MLAWHVHVKAPHWTKFWEGRTHRACRFHRFLPAEPRILSTPSSLLLASPSFMQHVKAGAMVVMVMAVTLSWRGWMPLWFYPSTSFKISEAAAKPGNSSRSWIDWFKMEPQNGTASWKNGGRPTVSTVVTMPWCITLFFNVSFTTQLRIDDKNHSTASSTRFQSSKPGGTTRHIWNGPCWRGRGGEWLRSKWWIALESVVSP